MKLFIKEVAQAKGFKNAKALADAMSEHFGVRISYSTIYPLWDDLAQLWSRSTIDKLCAFLNVPAGMLIQHIPGEVDTGSAGSFEAKSSPARKVAPSRKASRKARGARAAATVSRS